MRLLQAPAFHRGFRNRANVFLFALLFLALQPGIAVGELASALAHELNQPLTAVMNYAQAARRLTHAGARGASGKAQELMDKAVDQAERAAEDINAVVEEAGTLGLIGAVEKGVAVKLGLGAGLPPVLIDKIQIQQVVINLVRNAVEAMADPERRELTIETSPEGRGDAVEVAVGDTGPGLPETVADRLFQPFVTTKAEGMGIGLSISRSIVEAHGGRLWAAPNPDGGTTFRFTLPSAPVDEGHAA